MNAEQTLFLNNYGCGDYAEVTSECEIDGDTLALFLFRELAPDGNTRRDQYIQRLKNAEREIREVRQVLEEDQALAVIDGLDLAQALWWFTENVPLDAPWRTTVFFKLRERMRNHQTP